MDKQLNAVCASSLLARGMEAESLAKLVDRLGRSESLAVSGVFGSSLAFLLALVRKRLEKPFVLVTRGAREAEEVVGDLETLGGGDVYHFPAWETLPEEAVEPHQDILGDRFLVLESLLAQKAKGGNHNAIPPSIIVTTPSALAQRVVMPESLAGEMKHLSRGAHLSLEDLAEYLEKGGYRRVEMVEEKGEYCTRGGIVDLFPPASEYPVRLEFSGDEVATLRTFHTQTQRTISELDTATVAPFSELSLLARFRAKLGSLFDYLPPGAPIALHEPGESIGALESAARGGDYFLSHEDISNLLSGRHTLLLSLLPGEKHRAKRMGRIELEFQSIEQYRALALGSELGSEWQKRIFDSIEGWLGEGMQLSLFCNNAGEARRLHELLNERGIRLPEGSRVCTGRLSSGFIFREGKIVVLTDSELFGRYRMQRPRRRFKGTAEVREFSELKPGDYAVHVQHGIGIYRGISRLMKDGAEREFLCIEYQEKAKLYVPLEQASLVERYIGLGGGAPTIDRLGGARWQSVRVAAQKAIFDYAAEILELQAARSLKPGHAFPADTAWQKEFEDAFIYEETPDQISAIEDVKHDMERPHPMDRLVCGDVGYGKTEVAIRAAFRAVTDGKQVAVLVPTTILARQHLQTFSDRFADYPVHIEMLSRFRTAREQESVLEGLRSGGVDIVIGTHRLLQPDVAFKDLGLVVIDEEQRFGVAHKEVLKKLRLTVDVLTMTATPIPRTLYMSLAGIRDMSTINTPPEDRLAIETAVAEYDEELVRKAILREIGREGQVYFLHNRVETIERIKENLEKLVPEATYAVGHGQMAGEELEEAMRQFVEGKVDVLVCTTIIESGLDIPNANTLIIDNVERFGLADLYQLRGRVGRYKRRAYAYLLYRGDAVLRDDVRKRLKAIMEHSSLGSGFKIALRDLEIRGSGNILGSEQHGHVAAIGFDLYCKLLRRSIESLKGREVKGIEDIELNLPFATDIPSSYVPSEAQRIDLYKRLGEITSEEEIEEIASELRDRFGPVPEPAMLLFGMYRLKLTARDRGIRSVGLHEDKIVAVRRGEEIRPDGRYPRVTKKNPREMLREIREKIKML